MKTDTLKINIAAEVIPQGGESEEEANEGTSQQQQTTTGGTVQCVQKNSPVIIKPVGRGIWKCKGCDKK